MTMNDLKKMIGFTGAGVVAGVTGVLASPDVLAVVPPKTAAILKAIGAVLVIFGLRRRLPSA
jgi:hypothetical protein